MTTDSPLLPSHDAITVTPMHLGTCDARACIVVAAPTQLHDELLAVGLGYAAANPGRGGRVYPYRGNALFLDSFCIYETRGCGRWYLDTIVHTPDPHSIVLALRFPRGKKTPSLDACVQFTLDIWPELTEGWLWRQAQRRENDAMRLVEQRERVTANLRRDALTHIRQEFRTSLLADPRVADAITRLHDVMRDVGTSYYNMTDEERRITAEAALPEPKERDGLSVAEVAACTQATMALVAEDLTTPDPLLWRLALRPTN